MRSDMAKVIVERPRKKGWAWNKPKGEQRRLRGYGDEGPPAREGIQRRWQGRTKTLNEHLGPLRRYLDKQVGRPWDKVFSEICAHIDRNSAVQDHVRDHVAGYVATCVILIDGVPCDGEGGWGYGEPLHDFRYRPWYVCPRTGLLRRVRSHRRKPAHRSPPDNPPPLIPVGPSLQCRYRDGAWYRVQVQALPMPESKRLRRPCRDIWLDRPVADITDAEARKTYGAAVYAVAQQRLTRSELNQYPIPVEFWK